MIIAPKGFNYDVSVQDQTFNTTTYERDLQYPCSLVYRVLADYSCNYHKVLPKCSVKYVVIMRGGKGLGTELRVLTRGLIKSGSFDFVVDEPDPGKVIVVRCRKNSIVISYRINRLGDSRTSLAIKLLVPQKISDSYLKLVYKKMVCSVIMYKHVQLLRELLEEKTRLRLMIPPYFMTSP